MNPIEAILSRQPWFASLSDEERQNVSRSCMTRRFDADGIIVRDGDPVEHWFGVIDGLVKLCVFEESGQSTTLIGVPSGGWFGEGTVLNNKFWRYTAICMHETQVALMPKATFDRLHAENLAFNQFLLSHVNIRLSQLIDSLLGDRLLSPEARLAHCIAWLVQPQLYLNPEMTVSLSQNELGLLSGLSRQRANQAMRALTDAGLVHAQYGQVKVLNLDGLLNYK